MTCRFLDSLSLRTLLAPVAEEEFRARYWEQKPLIIHRRDPNFYGDLFTLNDFDFAIARAPDHVNTVNAGAKKQATTLQTTTVKGLEAVLAAMRAGDTLMLDRLDQSDAKLGLFCRVLGPQLGNSFQTILYLTPANGKGFFPHWDNHDVFILQVVGSKHWNIEKQRRLTPGLGETMGEDGRELRGELYSFTLEQGDLVYIPRGFVHAAECGADLSLHITFGVRAFFLEEVLYAAVKAASQRDTRLRAALPLGFMQGGPEPVARRAVTALREIADETFLGGVVDQFRDELVGTFPLDVSGQVVDFFKPTPLALDAVVGPRRGIVYQAHVGDESVRLNFGARSIVFPGLFHEALDFALKTPSYAIRNLPGELEDEERIVFTERLILEGLVVRK